MIVNVVCACIETFIEMFICFGVFIKAFGFRYKHSKYAKTITCIFIIVISGVKELNNTIYLFSISVILAEIPVAAITLWLISGKKFIQSFAWSCFSITTMLLLKLPTLIITSLIYNKSLYDRNLITNSQTWLRISNSIIFIILFLICEKQVNNIVKCLVRLPYKNIVLLFIGTVEYIIMYYIMCLGWYGFTIYTLILTLCLISMLFLIILCLIVLLEYQLMVRVNKLLKAKEDTMRMNYSLINKEIETNRKINHDNKHNLRYLYYCFEQRDYEKGIDYIRQKEKDYDLLQKDLMWSGYGSIDFLLNRAKVRSDEEKILFTIKVDIVEIPIEEYDFFSVLSNLLDNAIDASMQNDEGERYISLQILSLNNVFKLIIENSYLTEPKEKDRHFISSKNDKNLHGWGIENVKDIVDKYDGELDIGYGNGIFSVNLIIIQ